LQSVYEAHYPEVLYKAVVLNCPSYFTILCNALKLVTPPKTYSKFTFLSSMDQWKKDMIELMDPAVIPEQYGGTAKETEN